jgi:PEGA domain
MGASTVHRILAAAALAGACNQREPPKRALPAPAGSAVPASADAALAPPTPLPAPAPPPTPAPAPTPRPSSVATDPDLEIVTTGLPHDHFRVERRDGDLHLITSTPSAHVYIDGVLVGVTPLMLHLPPGKHRVELRVAGY